MNMSLTIVMVVLMVMSSIPMGTSLVVTEKLKDHFNCVFDNFRSMELFNDIVNIST